jgi:hypothetical protein
VTTATCNSYSVPYRLGRQELEALFTATTVEIFQGDKRVAPHVRSFAPYQYTTVSEHLPKSHQAHREWTPSRLIHWAESVGPATGRESDAWEDDRNLAPISGNPSRSPTSPLAAGNFNAFLIRTESSMLVDESPK